jgi:hypothetical protein
MIIVSSCPIIARPTYGQELEDRSKNPLEKGMVNELPSSSTNNETNYQQPYNGISSKDLNQKVDAESFHDQGNGVYWTRNVTFPLDIRYIRILFDAIKSPKDFKYKINILSLPKERMVASYSSDQFAVDDNFITELLPASDLRIELVSEEGAPKGLSFQLKEAIWPSPVKKIQPESAVYDWKAIRNLSENDPKRLTALSVVELHIGPLDGKCTGVLISKNTIATNNHCLEYSLAYRKTSKLSQPSCSDVTAEFDYLAANQIGPQATCLSIRTDPTLDVALLTFDQDKIHTSTGQNRNPVIFRPNEEGIPDDVAIIHHPAGLPMNTKKCETHGSDVSNIFHDCHTETGSSGAPLFDEKLRLVGLHYFGPYPETMTEAERRAAMGDAGDENVKYNRARTSNSVLNFINNNNKKE